MNEFSTTTLSMKKEFAVSKEKVFDAWFLPAQMKKWFFTTEKTNKLADNQPMVQGAWEIIDERDGEDYWAVGKYLEIKAPDKLVLTFRMPQYSEAEDIITVELQETSRGTDMSFTQIIHVEHEENWSEEDLAQAIIEYHDGSKNGWELMFDHLKQLLETGKVNYQL